MKRFILPALLLLATACTKNGAPEDPVEATADTLFIGSVVTNDPSHPRAEAVAIADGRILAVGTIDELRASVGPDTKTVDTHGAWILPGLVDAHAHLLGLGAALRRIDLVGTTSWDEILKKVQAAAAEQPDGWIEGRGWDQNDWKDTAFPDGRDLERVAPGRKVLLTRIDGHAVVASPAALEAAGIGASSKDPEGGRIVRDAKGEPTGVLVDNAISVVGRHIPEPTDAEVRARLDAALAKAAQVGLTGVHDMGVPAPHVSIYRQYAEEGKLTLRIYAALPGPTRLSKPVEDDWVSTRAVKLFADGALGSRGAALLAEYSDDPGNKGLLVTPQADLKAAVDRAVAAGFQPCIHAIGDRANRIVLDLFAESGAAEAGLRPRVEHAQVVEPGDLERFAQEDVIASMQPTHATSDMPWADDRLGERRLAGAYAWKTLLDSGAHLAFGSDFPVERPDPLEGLYAAVSRMDKSGNPKGGWRPQERLTFSEALAAFTSGAAYASFHEDRRGRIKKGFDADLTIVKGELSALVEGAPDADPQTLLDAEVIRTVVAGRTVYRLTPAGGEL